MDKFAEQRLDAARAGLSEAARRATYADRAAHDVPAAAPEEGPPPCEMCDENVGEIINPDGAALCQRCVDSIVAMERRVVEKARGIMEAWEGSPTVTIRIGLLGDLHDLAARALPDDQ